MLQTNVSTFWKCWHNKRDCFLNLRSNSIRRNNKFRGGNRDCHLYYVILESSIIWFSWAWSYIVELVQKIPPNKKCGTDWNSTEEVLYYIDNKGVCMRGHLRPRLGQPITPHNEQLHSDIYLHLQRPPKIESLANFEPIGRGKIPLN